MKCDGCSKEVKYVNSHWVRIPRPSDPSDMCAVLAGCQSCFPYEYGNSMTGRDWNDWMEKEGFRQGYLWLT